MNLSLHHRYLFFQAHLFYEWIAGRVAILLLLYLVKVLKQSEFDFVQDHAEVTSLVYW